MLKTIFSHEGRLSRAKFAPWLVSFVAANAASILIGMCFTMNLYTSAIKVVAPQEPAPVTEVTEKNDEQTLASVAEEIRNEMSGVSAKINSKTSMTYLGALGIFLLASFIMAMQGIKRLRDMGQNVLLILVPLISIVIHPLISVIFYTTIAFFPSKENTTV